MCNAEAVFRLDSFTMPRSDRVPGSTEISSGLRAHLRRSR
jgi:hypothetical protein